MQQESQGPKSLNCGRQDSTSSLKRNTDHSATTSSYISSVVSLATNNVNLFSD